MGPSVYCSGLYSLAHVYRERKVPGGSDWEFHFFPLFSFGQSPVGHWWNVLYGLAGYSREGAASKMKLLYIPITLSKDRRGD